MYNLLLVDDEQLILDGLSYNIDWSQSEIQDVFRAESADAAFAVMEQNQIHLVVSDIRMPGIDGLVLCREILSRWPYTKIILLSGYRDFEYAQQAVRLQVYRYLVKPVRYEELEQVVAEAIDQLKMDLSQRDLLARARQHRTDTTLLLQERYLDRWLISHRSDPAANPQEAQQHGVLFRAEDWAFLLTICIDRDTQQTIEDDVFRTAVVNLAQQIIPVTCDIYSFFNQENQCTLLYLGDGENLKRQSKRMIEWLEALQYAILQSMGCETSLFWWEPVPISEVATVFQRLLLRIHSQSGIATNSIMGSAALMALDESAECALPDQKAFANAILSLNKAKALEWLHDAFEAVKVSGASRELTMQLYHMVFACLLTDSVQRGISIDCWTEGFADSLQTVYRLHDVNALLTACRLIMEKYIDHTAVRSKSQNSRLIEKIKETVQQRYQFELSVSGLAKEYNYNAVYLSRIFKDEVGLSLQDYIISIRMEHAKRLLEQGGRVGEVAVAVGYDNMPHFSRLFKKHMGRSPKNYSTVSLL